MTKKTTQLTHANLASQIDLVSTSIVAAVLKGDAAKTGMQSIATFIIGDVMTRAGLLTAGEFVPAKAEKYTDKTAFALPEMSLLLSKTMGKISDARLKKVARGKIEVPVRRAIEALSGGLLTGGIYEGSGEHFDGAGVTLRKAEAVVEPSEALIQAMAIALDMADGSRDVVVEALKRALAIRKEAEKAATAAPSKVLSLPAAA